MAPSAIPEAMSSTNVHGNKTTKPLHVIVVGAGFGGLTAAIECRRRGMEVTLIEKHKSIIAFGDVIDFFANAGRIIEKWDDGEVARKMYAVGIHNKTHDIFRYDGELFFQDPFTGIDSQDSPDDERITFIGHRGEFHMMVYEYAVEIGVKFSFGTPVVDYFENALFSGVLLSSGETVWGDVVCACDGPKSSAKKLVLGIDDKSVNSGYAIYRSFFDVDDSVRNDPLTKIYSEEEDHIQVYLGSHVHFIAFNWKKGKDLAWVLTHKDDHDIQESWSFPGSKEDVLAYIEDWCPKVKAIIDKTPADRVIDYKLVFRRPLPSWRSPGGLTTLLGDAVHTHLPTSAQGASQAMEDAVTFAMALERLPGDVRLALKAFERIRYNRASVIQNSGITNRDTWHGLTDEDWAEFRRNPEKLRVPRLQWVVGFDPIKHVDEVWDSVITDLLNNKQGTLEELSVPAGGGFEEYNEEYAKAKGKDQKAVPSEVQIATTLSVI